MPWSVWFQAGSRLTLGLTTPLALAANKAIEVASDFAESQNVIEVAFGDSASKIDAWAKTVMDDFGLSQLTAKQYAGQFMTLANAMGIAQDAGADMSTTLTGLSSDMASFYNVRQDIAANALKAIFTGESETLKQFGVVMLDANLSAFALSKGIKTTYANMSQAEKVMLRYQFVTEALSLAQGDFARTSDGLANQQRILQEQYKELAIELGAELLPIAKDVITWINGMVKAFASLTDGQKKAVLVIVACAAALGPLVTLVGGVSKAVGAAVTMWKAFTTAQAAATAAVAAGNSGVKAFTASLVANTAAQAAATAGISLLVTALVSLVTKIVVSQKNLETMTGRIDNLNRHMEDVAQNGFESAREELAKLDNVAENILPRIEELANKTKRTAEETNELQALIPISKQYSSHATARGRKRGI
ncbi:MAG: phage tail tape measure protein [Candidatus Spyradocola sp.]